MGGDDGRMDGAARVPFRGGEVGAGISWAASSISWSFGCFRCCVLLVSSCTRVEEKRPGPATASRGSKHTSPRFGKAVDVCIVTFAIHTCIMNVYRFINFFLSGRNIFLYLVYIFPILVESTIHLISAVQHRL